MPRHSEKRYLSHSQGNLYSLVADIEKYPEFLPWCKALTIISQNDNLIRAEMVIGFKFFQEKFTTEVCLTPNTRIDVKYLNGPFKYLQNHWSFESNGEDGCKIDFFVDFEFKSPILQKMMGLVFSEALAKMILAFENRANNVYKKRL